MTRALALRALATPVLATGCVGNVKDNTKDSADTGIPAADCDDIFSSFFLTSYTEIVSMCVAGTSNVGVPPNFQVEVPHFQAPYLAYPTWDDYDGFNYEMSINNISGPLLNAAGLDGYSWPWEHDPVCSDYPVDAVNWYVIDGVNLFWSGLFGPECNGFPPPLPPAPSPMQGVESGPQACVPGEADFDLAVRRVFHRNPNKATMWLSPVLTENGSIPERAWMRELTVTDWGSGTNLHLGDYTKPLTLDNWGFEGTQVITPSETGPTAVTFDVGETPMSVLMATSEMPFVGAETPLPKLRIRWSCERDETDPHDIPVAGYQPHVLRLPPASGVRSRVVFWVSDDATSLRMAPEGRYLDYTQTTLTDSTLPGKAFTLQLAGYDATFSGRLVPWQGSFKIIDPVVAKEGQSQGLSNLTLSPLE